MRMVSSIPLDGGGVVEAWVRKDGGHGGGDFIRLEMRYQNHRHQLESSEPKTSTFKLKLRSDFDDDYAQYVWATAWEALDNLGVDFPARTTAIDAVVRGLSCLMSRRPSHAVMLEVKIEVGVNPNSGDELELELELEIENRRLDLMARWWVLKGDRVKKHTKGGKGFAHQKLIRMVMVRRMGPMLQWVSPNGKSFRNVIPKRAHVGPSRMFEKNRRSLLGRGDAQNPGVFRVVTTEGEEVHFDCEEGGLKVAQLWVRGINLLINHPID